MNLPIEYPKVVYKYRDWSNKFHKEILHKNQLYLPSPDEFNDPFDCKIPLDFTLLEDDEKKRKFIEKELSQILLSYGKIPFNISEKTRENYYRLKNDIEKYEIEYTELFLNLPQYFGILSLSKKWDSILMWSHYANYHKGFCIGFNLEKLNKTSAINLGIVDYPPNNDFPRISPLEDNIIAFIQTTFSKSKEWGYEDEYRLVKVYDNAPSKEDRKITITDECIAEIIIGISADNETKKELVEIANAKNIKIYQAKKVPRKYEIDREIII
jgi:hypothetical protein